MLGKLKAWISRRKKLVIVAAIAGGSFLSYSFVEDYYFEVGKNLDIYTTLFRDVNIYYVDSIQPGDQPVRRLEDDRSRQDTSDRRTGDRRGA